MGIDKGAISFSFLRQDITHPGSITDPIWRYKEGGAGVGYIFDFDMFLQLSQQMNINETVYAGNNELLLSSWQGMNYNEAPIKAFSMNSYTNQNVPVIAIDLSILIKSKELTNPRPFIPSITAD